MSKTEEAMMKNIEDILRPSDSDPSVNFEKSFHEIMIRIQTLINTHRNHFVRLAEAEQIRF